MNAWHLLAPVVFILAFICFFYPDQAAAALDGFFRRYLRHWFYRLRRLVTRGRSIDETLD